MNCVTRACPWPASTCGLCAYCLAVQREPGFFRSYATFTAPNNKRELNVGGIHRVRKKDLPTRKAGVLFHSH